MAIHNKSHYNHALMSVNKMRKDNNFNAHIKFQTPEKPMIYLEIMDCCDF